MELILSQSHIPNYLSRAGVSSRVTEDKNLVFACALYNLLIADLIEEHHSLDGFLFRDTDVNLLKRYWAIALIKVMKPSVWVYS